MRWFFAPSWMLSRWRRPAPAPYALWYANESLALLQRALFGAEFGRPERFQRMALDAAHVTFGDITSGYWRKDFPVGDTITIRLPQQYQAGA